MSLSRHAFAVAAVAVACVLAFSPSARAGELIRVELIPKAQQGQGQPALVVHAEAELANLTLDLTRASDKKRIQLKSGPIPGGKLHRFSLELAAPGKARFSGTLAVKASDGQGGEMPIDVEAELLAPLAVRIAPEDVDLAKRLLTIRADRSLKKVQITVMSDTGTPLGTTEEAVEGSEVRVGWNQSAGTPLRISVQGWDTDGFFGGVDLFPWRVDIPHEEVNFDTGSHEILPREAPKLEASLKQVKEAIDKYGKLAAVRLFIAGHTDTVGDTASNHALSDRRARAIGQWFKKHGIAIPISTAGFGEDLLLVKTPDETDELKNRRAEYIVAVEAPAMRNARWTPLR